jgi:hypothetical protein
METVTGEFKITGIDFSSLSTTQKTELKSTCETQIAVGAGVAASDVAVILAQGSIVVTYTITLPAESAYAAVNALASPSGGIESASFLADLQTAIQTSVTGMTSITLTITDVVTATTTFTGACGGPEGPCPGHEPSDKASSLGGAYVALALSMMGSAVAHII